jgi:predicted alpha/beta-fold hydrolase
LVGKPEGHRPLGRPRRRRVDKMDLVEIGWGGVDWIILAQDRDNHTFLELTGCCKNTFNFRRSNVVYPFVFTTGNASKILDFVNVTKPTVIVFHGYSGSETSSFMRNVTAVYLSRVSIENLAFCSDI